MIRNATEILKKNDFEISAVGTTLSWNEGETLTPAEPHVAVFVPLAGKTVGQKYALRLCLQLEGERDTYSACGFVTDEGELVDDGLERGAPTVLCVPATAVEREGATCACFYLMAAKGESLSIQISALNSSPAFQSNLGIRALKSTGRKDSAIA